MAGDGENKEGNGDGNPPPSKKETDPTEAYKTLLAKHNNDANAVALSLFQENHKLRGKNAKLRESLPASDAVVLAGDDLKAWGELKELGKTPAELKTMMTEHGEFVAADAKRKTETAHKEYADLLGWKPTVLTKLLTDDQLEIEIEDQVGPKGQPVLGRDGKQIRIPMVKVKDEKDARKTRTIELKAYAEKHWGDWLPSLQGDTRKSPPTPGTPPPTNNPPPPPRDPAPGLYGRRNPLG